MYLKSISTDLASSWVPMWLGRWIIFHMDSILVCLRKV